MNKKKLTVLALMMALLMVLSLSIFVACNEAETPVPEAETEKETIKATEGLLISNSDFKVVDTSDKAKYPLSVTGWTGAKLYSSGDYETGVIAGAISLEEALYSANKANWKDDADDTLYNALKSHYSADENAVNNALMIYMPTKAEDTDDTAYGPTAYGYTSSAFSLEASKYYKLSIDVLTYKIAGTLDSTGVQDVAATPGANIYVSSGTYAEYKQINTNGAWTTYTVYFESAATAATSLSVRLSLGFSGSNDKTASLTTGYAFFDNVNLEVVEKSAYDTAKVSEANDDSTEADDTYRLTNKTITCKVMNGRFEYGTIDSTSSSATANGWSIVMGNKGKTDVAPSSDNYRNGIIDIANFADDYANYSTTYYQMSGSGLADAVTPSTRLHLNNVADTIKAFGDNRVGTNVFMLSQQTMTAQGLKSGSIVIEKGKRYAVSVSLYTFDIRGAGVTLELSGDGNPIYIKGISENKSAEANINGLYMFDSRSNGGWNTYTFYVEGNQYADYTYAMTFWLGTGGTSDNTAVTYDYYSTANASTPTSTPTTYTANGTFTTGWVFFDELNLAELTAAEFDAAGSGATAENMSEKDSEGYSAIASDFAKVSLKTKNLFEDTTINADFAGAADDATSSFDNGTLGTPAGFTCSLDAEDTTLPYVSADILTAGVVSLEEGADFTALGVAHPSTPYDIVSKRAYMLNAKADTHYSVETDLFTVKANNFYRISMWIKTADVKSTAGVYVYLIDDEDATRSSFTLINTTDYTDEENPVSEWKEYVFYIRGANAEDTQLRLEYAFGSGTRWTSATLAKGAAFISDLSMTGITYDDYTAVSTGTNVKALDLSSTYTYTFDNGGFDNFSFSDTKGLNASGQLADKAGVPTDWTINDSKYKPSGDDNDAADSEKTYLDDANLVAGIIKLDVDAANDKYFRKSAQITNLFGSTIAAEFDALYGAEDDTYFNNYQRIGGPSMLAIGSANANKYYRSFKSDSFSLSANTKYTLSVWAKNIGETTYGIYLTGSTNGQTYFNEQPNFVVKNATTSDWTCYTFYIEVGLSSASLNLNLCLGYNETISGTLAGMDEFSNGIVLFDNITLHNTLTDEEFDAVTDTDDNERKMSFMTNGFEISDGTTYSSNKPVTPSGYTGAVGTDQSSSDTTGGIVYKDNAEHTYAVDSADAANDLYKDLVNAGYVSLFGKAYDYTTYEILQTEIDALKAAYASAEVSSDAEIAAAVARIKTYEATHGAIDVNTFDFKTYLQKLRMYADMKANYITVDELAKTVDNSGADISSTIGNSFLIINNKAASAYTYTSSSFTFTAEKYYMVSLWVRTYNIDSATGGANVQLYLGSANEAKAPLIYKGIKDTAWTKYTFYVKTLEDNVTSVTLKLSLGEYDEDDDTLLASGYAMFDAITIDTIDETAFTAIETESTKDAPDTAIFDESVMKIHTVPEPEEEGDTTTEEEPAAETPNEGFNLDYLWWMIPTILLALATIAVVVAFFIKKIRKPKKASEIEAPETSEAIEEKRNKYEDYNE